MSRIRLICPNCAAQYEVPSDVIPQGGRDVQCSNCGHTWYQSHPDDDSDLAAELNQPIPDPSWKPEDAEPDDWADDDTLPGVPEAAEPPAEGPTVTARGPEGYQPPETETPPPPPQTRQPAPAPSGAPAEQAPPQRPLDPEVAEVLREERDHERRQREAEAGAFESQPDLGLRAPNEDEQARRAREARERMAVMRGEADTEPARSPERSPERGRTTPVIPDDPEPEPPLASGRDAALAAAAAAGSRRQLLPDVEEINQSLRGGDTPRAVDQAERRELMDEEPARSGFRRGFLWVVILVVLAIALYILAPRLAEMLPGLAPALDAYVAQVDALRLWLDGQVSGLLATLDGMSSEAQPPAE